MIFDKIQSDSEYNERLREWKSKQTSNSKVSHDQLKELITLYRYKHLPHQEWTQCGSCVRRMLKAINKDFDNLG